MQQPKGERSKQAAEATGAVQKHPDHADTVVRGGEGVKMADKTSQQNSSDPAAAHIEEAQNVPPPAYHPPPSSTHPAGPNLGQSVVNDLMRVYESLTQSSTPQVPSTQQQHQPAQSQHQPQSHPPSQPQTAQPQTPQVPNPINQQSQQPHYYPHQQQEQQQQHQTYYQQQPVQNQPPKYQYTNQAPPPAPPHDQQHYAYAHDAPHQVHSYQHHHPQLPHGHPPLQQGSSGGTPPPEQTTRSRKRGRDNDIHAPTTKSRKKGSSSDPRWSKRFTWPDELHRDFVAAVFDVGLKHSSPSSILENMRPNEQITSERIKSHLQKYRLHRAKSKREFMTSYDSALNKFKAGIKSEGGEDRTQTLSCGEVAAHLSYSTMTETNPQEPAKTTSMPAAAAPVSSSAAATSIAEKGGTLHLPQLTEEEKQSPLGASMGYLMGLFFSLRQQIMEQREGKGPAETSTFTSQTVPQAPPSAPMLPERAEHSYPPPHQQPGTVANPVQSVYASFAAPGPASSANQHHQGPAPVQYGAPTVQSQPPPPPPPTQPPWTRGNQGQSGSFAHQPTVAPLSPVPPGSASSAVATTRARAAAPSSSHAQLEESNMMKREMQHQMAFQNKMRALKQQELNKYKSTAPSQSSAAGAANSHDRSTKTGGAQSTDANPSGSASDAKLEKDGVAPGNPASEAATQGAGEPATDGAEDSSSAEGSKHTSAPQGGDSANDKDTKQRGISVGGSEEFWDTDVVDEQLFEFLMNT